MMNYPDDLGPDTDAVPEDDGLDPGLDPGLDGAAETVEVRADDRRAVLTRKPAGGSPLKTFLLIGALIVGAIVMATFSWIRSSRQQVQTEVRAGSVEAPINDGVGATEELSPLYLEMARTDNERAIEAGEAQGYGAVVVPRITGDPTRPTPQEEPDLAAVTIEPYRGDGYQPVSRPSTPGAAANVAALRAAAEAARGRWGRVAAQGVSAGAPVRAEVAESPVPDGPAPPPMPTLQVMPAVVEVGASSDAPAEVVARFTSGPLRGGRLLGSIAAIARNGDSVQLRFTLLQWQGVDYAIDAMAVDPATRIPTVAGSVNHHIIRNVAATSFATFLAGYAAAARNTTRIGSIDVESGLLFRQQSSADAVRAQAASEGASVLARLGGRPPTVKVPIGTPIGVVILSAPETAGVAASAASPTMAATSDGREAPTRAAEASPPVPSRTVLSDGTTMSLMPYRPND
jgi:hypothetical protein